jgi:hypothetical protein
MFERPIQKHAKQITSKNITRETHPAEFAPRMASVHSARTRPKDAGLTKIDAPKMIHSTMEVVSSLQNNARFCRLQACRRLRPTA